MNTTKIEQSPCHNPPPPLFWPLAEGQELRGTQERKEEARKERKKEASSNVVGSAFEHICTQGKSTMCAEILCGGQWHCSILWGKEEGLKSESAGNVIVQIR